MLVDAKPSGPKNFENHLSISQRYGAKAAGLAMLPPQWRLDFAALSIESYDYWLKNKTVAGCPEIASLKVWLKKKNFTSIIVRSSGIDETLYDRGKFRSVILKQGWDYSQLEATINDIFRHALQTDAKAKLGIVVQEFLKPDFAGHLSNEHRVSPTINQWSYELEFPNWAPSKGINSKFTTSPDPNSPLHCGNQIPHQPLRSVAHFLAAQFKQRCHLEWMVYRSTLFLAQIDFEWPEHDVGLDPKKDIKAIAPPELDLDKNVSLKPYEIGTQTHWPKLKNLSDFDFNSERASPRIYPLDPKTLKAAFGDQELMSSLKQDMVALTGNRLVVRTDCIQEGIGHFNLPRTDTKTVEDAISWCREKITALEGRGVEEENYMFLFHAFLPARASAWAYAKPNSPTVIVDALWGLPDGLQVLPVDTYEVNVARNEVVKTKSTFKPKFLTELEDGTWDYRHVKSKSGRNQVLSLSDKVEIAKRTKDISDKLGDEAQIMWFCDIPDGYKVGRNLPWFRSREKFDPAPRQEVQFKPFPVSKPEDLIKLPPEKVTIQLLPEANLIRDESFLDKIVDIAKEKQLPVQLEGSILSHVFYKLNQAGISVVLSNSPKYYRKRQKKIFGKLVRDKIPTNIAAGGEAVREAKIAKSDLNIALAGKLLEEVEELLKASSREDQAAELSDILEVLKGLAKAYNVEWSDVETLALQKAEKRGGFEDGRVLIETALPHRDSLLERDEHVRITDLGRVDCTDTRAEIPSSSLMATAFGPGVIFSFEDDPVRFRVAMRQGRLQITKIDQKVPQENKAQRELFDFE
ncbi:nucleoside triphosphate pyrophosphohydrolase [Shinella daejeonensis]|uniref:nucleoside triphosphate pyrophosphohydrolase n=1 Tax=Shinella daejeonensis TaxID=659017 RepID=UPI0020C7B75E|nr:nucleoside triphosphate pyrophosphohydrolase [Shinella daejeonensis]MCP8896351.1 nucleoside triphosphate pyrophosphohydrolase [Shinella daejeonensis]